MPAGCRLLALVLSLTACAGAKRIAYEEPKEPTDEVAALIANLYAALAHGDADALASHLTHDALVFGLGPLDTFNDRATAAVRLRQWVLPLATGGDELTLVSSSPTIGICQGEESAWVSDLPRVEVLHRGARSTWLPRVTAHAIRLDNGWHVDALHVSLAVDDTLVYSPDSATQFPPPADVSNERGRGSDELAGLTRRFLEDFEVKIESATDRREFIEIGTAPTEVFESGTRFKKLLRPALPGIRKEAYDWRLEGNLRSRVAPDGKSGWAAGNVVLRIGTGKKQKVLPAIRTLWVFAFEHSRWSLASEHQSFGVNEALRAPATTASLKAWAELNDARTPRKAAPPAPEAIHAW